MELRNFHGTVCDFNPGAEVSGGWMGNGIMGLGSSRRVKRALSRSRSHGYLILGLKLRIEVASYRSIVYF
jgi:hypothetical protein